MLIILQFDILVYNPVARGNDNIVVRVPISRKDLVVTNTDMSNVQCQVIITKVLPNVLCSVCVSVYIIIVMRIYVGRYRQCLQLPRL